MGRRHRLLLDCDELLSDFVGTALRWIHGETGTLYTYEDVTQWNIFKSLDCDDLERGFREYVARGGICAGLPVLPGSQEAVKELRRMCEVYVVTSPYAVPNWVYERTEWLVKNFAVSPEFQIHTRAKQAICGDIIVDDSLLNVVKWKSHWPRGLALLWDAPYNRSYVGSDLTRVHGWDDVVQEVGEYTASTRSIVTVRRVRR